MRPLGGIMTFEIDAEKLHATFEELFLAGWNQANLYDDKATNKMNESQVRDALATEHARIVIGTLNKRKTHATDRTETEGRVL